MSTCNRYSRFFTLSCCFLRFTACCDIFDGPWEAPKAPDPNFEYVNVRTTIRCMHDNEVKIEDMKLFIFRYIENVPEKVFCAFKCMAESSGFVVNESVMTDHLAYFPMLPSEISRRNYEEAIECLNQIKHHKVYDCLSIRPAMVCIKDILKEPFLFQYPDNKN